MNMILYMIIGLYVVASLAEVVMEARRVFRR